MNDSNRLKSIRENKGLSCKDVAAYLGMHRNTLLRYEQGHFEPDISTIKKLAKLYNVSIDYLLGASDNPHPVPESNSDYQGLTKEQIDALKVILNSFHRDNKKDK